MWKTPIGRRRQEITRIHGKHPLGGEFALGLQLEAFLDSYNKQCGPPRYL